MNSQNISAIVLAAGKGTRMKSELPKVLHQIGNKPMIQHTLDTLSSLNFGQIIVVVGYGADQVQDALGPNYIYAFQENPAGGTADAVKVGLSKLDKKYETILVVGGDDSAFYKPETLSAFLRFHLEGDYTISAITTEKPQTERLGRIIRDEAGDFENTMETWEYEKSGLYSDEVNCGTYIFQTNWLKDNIDKIDNNNDKSEYRITEALNLAHTQKKKIGLFKLSNPDEWVGVNTPEDLEKAKKLMEDR